MHGLPIQISLNSLFKLTHSVSACSHHVICCNNLASSVRMATLLLYNINYDGIFKHGLFVTRRYREYERNNLSADKHPTEELVKQD